MSFPSALCLQVGFESPLDKWVGNSSRLIVDAMVGKIESVKINTLVPSTQPRLFKFG